MEKTSDGLKKGLLNINELLTVVLSGLRERQDIADNRFDDWYRTCGIVRQQIAEELVRVAVIGPIKSGKSTFVNSLFGGDYLKRGAGIVTSIITRIRSGKKLKAVLYFKSWDEVNTDIEQALDILPTWEKRADDEIFDIRKENDRQSLIQALDRLGDDTLIADGTRNATTVLLSLYLKGYDSVSAIISGDSTTAKLSGKRFAEHRSYVGEDALAVYLKDVELEIAGGSIDRSVEIADCQGSDSPNPLHLAMIQDYLIRTHFIVYVISSRTGLRQADIRFLLMIKKMRMLEHMLFVVNVDYSEHDSLEDINGIVDKVKEDLSLIRPEPKVYALSALFDLFKAEEKKLTKRDKLRLAQWEAEDRIVEFLTAETSRFRSTLNERLSRDRLGILMKNHLERMDIIASGVERWAATTGELLVKDIDGAATLIHKMERHQERIEQMRLLVKSTLNGAMSDIIKKTKADVDRFFNPHSSSMMGQAHAFVKQYTVSVDKYHSRLAASGFSNTLYYVFQEFKQALDRFMTETVNPEIAQFAGEAEERIKVALESVAVPYQEMASDNLAEFRSTLGSAAVRDIASAAENRGLLDMDLLKRTRGLSLPSTAATLQYSVRLKTEAMMHLGFYSVVKMFRKILKKPAEGDRVEQMRALSAGFKIIKKETEQSIAFHFENYRENLKFQYFAKLIDAAGGYMHDILMERFNSYDTNIKSLEHIAEKKGSSRTEMIEFLDRVKEDAQRMRRELGMAREAVEDAG
jgi:hypothetical protein